MSGLPAVTVHLVDNGDGTHGIGVSISGTADLLLAMSMLAQAQVSVCGRASEVAAAERSVPVRDPANGKPSLLVLPGRRIGRG